MNLSQKIILASASPRRQDLLRQIGLTFEVIPSNEPEIPEPTKSVPQFVMDLALQKASAIATKVEAGPLVIGADTVVCLDTILGKPTNAEEALGMLIHLSGKWHEVISGLAVLDTKTGKQQLDYVITKVKMRDYSQSEIKSYIATGEPMDKAGAYGIQGMGALLVEKIEGCYFNVVGLPLQCLYRMLKQWDINLLSL